MIKVMIVDDEKIFRDYLRSLIPWTEYGMQISLEARNGVQALEAARAQPPDIALVDINMPQMDGLELTRELKRLRPDMSIVLVTGHNEFEYARQALRLGVEDYILKPFSREELLLTLVKLQTESLRLQEERQTRKANASLLKETWLTRLVLGELALSEEQLSAQLTEWGYAPASGLFQVACIELDQMEARWRSLQDRELWKFAVTNILHEAMALSGNHIVFNGPEGRIVCIYEAATMADGPGKGSPASPGSPGTADLAGKGSAGAAVVSPNVHNVQEAYGEACEQLIFLIKKYLKFAVTIGIGSVHAGLDGIGHAYREALDALQHKFVIGSDRVIRYSKEVQLQGKTEGYLSAPVNEALILALRMNDLPALERQLEDVFSDMRQQRLSIDYIYVICMGLVSLCLSCVSENGHPIEDCFGEDFYPYNEIMQKPGIEEAAAWIKGLYAKAAAYIKLHRQTKSSRIAETAKSYIDAHYTDPELKVEQIAQQVYINPSYLRAIFKKVHGMTVTDYVMQRRMQQARTLLAEGMYKLADIAHLIGYNDPAYFSRAFKKYYGYSPSEYENIR